MTNWRIALLYNLKRPSILGADDAPDMLADLADPETVQNIERALLATGHEVIPLEADATLLDSIRQTNPDICFNIARGLNGKNRLSQIPALLEMLSIPFTGSDAQAHLVARDKSTARHLWQTKSLPVADGQIFQQATDVLAIEPLRFPLIVKPVREGSGTGLNAESIVHNEAEMRMRIEWVINTYQQPALVERYLPGREFSVGIFGNATMSGHQQWSDLYGADGFHIFPLLEVNTTKGSANGVYGADARLLRPDMPDAPNYLCPAALSSELETELQQLALNAFKAVGASDVARVDLRLDEEGKPHLIEIDTLPNLDPYIGDLFLTAKVEGISYDNLINEILQLAMARNGLMDWQLRPTRALYESKSLGEQNRILDLAECGQE